MEWKHIDTLPPAGERPGRAFVVVQGFQSHSGMDWLRREAGIARTNNEGFYGEDIALIEEQGHMEKGSGVVTHWMPWCLPCLPDAVSDY